MSRIAQAMSNMPMANLGVISLCCLTYAFQILADPILGHYTLCPRNVIYLHEYYRVVTSSFFHGGMMHLAMNVMSTAAIGSLLERWSGTLRHVTTIAWSVLLTSLIYCSAAYISCWILGMDNIMYQHSVGFSGVIFHLSVLEANLNPHGTRRSVFGFLTVSSAMYPWALLVVLQFIMPQVSFWGHLSGILVGTLQLHGVLDWILPSNEYLREMETWSITQHLKSRPNYVPTPSDESLPGNDGGRQRGARALLLSTFHACQVAWKLLKDIAETIKFCIFGYTHRPDGEGISNDGDGIGAESGAGNDYDTDTEMRPLRDSDVMNSRIV